MALQLGALLDALEEAGASHGKATAAAEELASFEARFASTDSRLAGVEARLSSIDGRISMLTWVLGIQASATLVILGSTFALWPKLGDVSGQLVQISSQLAQIAHAVH
jgi:hypothetical protein